MLWSSPKAATYPSSDMCIKRMSRLISSTSCLLKVRVWCQVAAPVGDTRTRESLDAAATRRSLAGIRRSPNDLRLGSETRVITGEIPRVHARVSIAREASSAPAITLYVPQLASRQRSRTRSTERQPRSPVASARWRALRPAPPAAANQLHEVVDDLPGKPDEPALRQLPLHRPPVDSAVG